MTKPAAASSRAAEPLVRCEDLMVRFVGRDGAVHAVNGVSFTLDAGEVLCILGESGSGKSVTLRAMMRLLPAHIARISGSVRVAGRNVMELDRRSLEDLRALARTGVITGAIVGRALYEGTFRLEEAIATAGRRLENGSY